jgi:hypothetical protein
MLMSYDLIHPNYYYIYVLLYLCMAGRDLGIFNCTSVEGSFSS